MVDYVSAVADRTKANKVAADDMNRTQQRINAIETKLGLQPEGLYTTVEARLGFLIIATEKGVANGVATLGPDGKIPSSQFPINVGANNSFPAASESAMLALPAGIGDVAVRTDLDPIEKFILLGTPASTLSNWQSIPEVTGGVTTVDGVSGSVDLTNVYLTQASAAFFFDVQQDQIDLKADKNNPTLTGTTTVTTLVGATATFSSVVKVGTPVSATDAVTKAYLESRLSEAAGGGGFSTVILWSQLDGADDDAMFDDFLTQTRQLVYKPLLFADECREYGPFDSQHPLHDGFGFGGIWRSVDQSRKYTSGTPAGWRHPLPQRFKLSQPSARGWLTLPTIPGSGTPSATSDLDKIFGVYINGVSMDANSNSRMFHPTSAVTLWTSQLYNLSYQNGPGIIGSGSQYQALDVVTFGGFWNVNNVTDCVWNVAGSDNRFDLNLSTLDSPTASGSVANTVLTKFTDMSKTIARNMYITCEQKVGVIITGTSTQQMMRILECEIEGRNVTHPSWGSIIRILGADVTIKETWVAFGMSDPANANGGATLNRGVIHIDEYNSSGTHFIPLVVLDGLTYRPASGVATTVPFIYVGAGEVHISNIVANTAKSTTTSDNAFRPRVEAAVGARVYFDSSVVAYKYGTSTPITSGVEVA